MRQMHHMEKPKLAVTERALIAYEMEQGQAPGEKKPAPGKAREEKRTVCVGAGCEPGTDESLRRARL